MPLLDRLQDTVRKIVPTKESIPPVSGSVMHEEDMIISKPAIVFHACESFFSFLAMACFASVAAFQAKFHVGPSGLSGFALFVSIVDILLPLFLLLVPVVYEKYDKAVRLARALKEPRVGFILVGTGLVLEFLLSFIVTISAWTEPGCKKADNDPNASKGDAFKAGLDGWCTTKKAGAIFFWIATIFWIASSVVLVLDWRSGKSKPRRDPNFNPPSQMPYGEVDDEDEEDRYNPYSAGAPQIPPMRRGTAEDASSPFSDDHRYGGPEPAGRPSIDAYGAFSDPAPSGYGMQASPGVSRTMQYADPYAQIRDSITAPPAAQQPPAYPYEGYR